MSLTDRDVIDVIDSKIAETRHEQERLRRAAELLPTVNENLAALLRTRELLGAGKESEIIVATSDSVKQTSGVPPKSIGALVVEALREAGQPLHVNELMNKLHVKGSKVARHTLVGTLARYVKESRLRRTAPSIYALPSTGPI